MSNSINAVLVASLTLSLTAFAQQKKEKENTGAPTMEGAAMTHPVPSKELETFMKPIEGSWSCDTKMMAGSMGPNSPETTMKSKVKFTKDKESNGIWYRGEYTMPKTKNMPAMSGTFLMSHDDTNKVLTNVAWDSMGMANLGTGNISGETMSWSGEGVMNGQKMKTRDTFTKSGKNIVHKFEADMGKGFVPMGEDTCTKEMSKT